ncbi:S-layer homology domain-containing protein [Paenibacillus sp. 22594]|uniref:S-layer homology domain-containing protein n=1 Tax=Paenibacillus sp. 22594 TaxID=3453947 RepID=UPI003F86698F
MVYTATITITPKPGYTLTGVPAYFFTVPGASTTNTANSGVVTAEFPATAPDITDTGTGNTVTPSTNNIITSTNGKITLPVNQAGEVSFEDGVKISIPAGAAAKELIVSIEKVLEPQKLFPNKEILLSPVYEITKNFAEDFSKPVTLKIAFDPALVTSNQQVVIFYYDEVKKAWIEAAGSKIEGNHIIVEVNRVGKYTVLSVDKVTGLPVRTPVTESPTEITLRDVAGHWAAASIQQALSMGMVKGYLDGTFRPNHSVTRAEFAVMLMNVLKPQGAGANLTFTDTATIGAWAQSAIAQAVQAGIITGYEDGGFRPNAEITRAEMAVILAKALGVSTEGKTTSSFSDDKDIPAWAKSSVDFVKQAGIAQGKGENAFAPQDSATRAEAVTVLLKLLAQWSN